MPNKHLNQWNYITYLTKGILNTSSVVVQAGVDNDALVGCFGVVV